MGLHFTLKAALRMSSDVTPAREMIGEYLEEANRTVLVKGAPDGYGAQVVEWAIDGNKVNLIIESGRYIHAHDALMRIRKPLASKLGKDFRIGLRAIEVESFVISMPAKNP